MPGIARQFEPQITRTGGAPSKYRFTALCSACHKPDTYQASKPVGDELVKGYFKDRGWLLGRDRAYDLCPACLAKPRETQQPRSFHEAGRHRSPEAANHSERLTVTAPADKRSRDTADILARHLGKPEALAAEVFRPKPVQSPRSSAPDTPEQAGSTPALLPEVEQVLTGMAADLKGLRSTLELMAEQVSKLVALGGQQIEAIARLAPLMVQSAEGISGGLRDVVSAIQTIPSSSPPAREPTKAEEPITRETEPVGQPDPDISPGPEPLAGSRSKGRSRQKRQPQQTEDQPHQTASAPVVVRSIPDARRADQFYTSIRLPRELWDQAGFRPDDRVRIDWTGKTLSIGRDPEGGVKPKSVRGATVVLQSWRLGDLSFDQARIAIGITSLRLTTLP